jgi:hypothetical protein
MLSDLQIFFFAFAILEYRYLRVDSYTNIAMVLPGSRPLTPHIIIITRLKADRHL